VVRTVDTGLIVIGSIVLVWPLGAAVALAVVRPGPARRWRPFAVTAVLAAITSALLFGYALVLFSGNGTSRAMASLGPQIGGAATLGGALLCAVTAAVLRLTTGSATEQRDPS
jgi:hypothetical protein